MAQKLFDRMLEQVDAAFEAGRYDLMDLFMEAAHRLLERLDAPRA
jgi:hypothetical protein